MERRTIRIAAVTVACVVVVLGCGVFAFLYAGGYPIAARKPHPQPEFVVLDFVQRRSVRAHAARAGIEVPPLDDEQRIRRGFARYRKHCVTCHGAPGEARTRVGIGVNPNPPSLERAAVDWSTAEIHWIIANGLKMAGMPSFELGGTTEEIWDLTAFVLRLHTLTPDDYRKMVAASEGRLAQSVVAWRAPAESGWTELASRGRCDRGRRLVRERGCDTCHEVPGVSSARASIGPPLSGWRARHYLAGHFLNVPVRLVAWLLDPQTQKPDTAMPSVGLNEQEAWDIACYLYALE